MESLTSHNSLGLHANFWQDKIKSKNVIKEKKLFDDLISSYEGSIKKLDDLTDLFHLAKEEKNQNIQNEILLKIKDLRNIVKKRAKVL